MMPKDAKKIIQALAKAIEWEREGLRTYLGYALATQDITGKNMFIILAGDEMQHAGILEEQMEKFARDGKWKRMTLEPSIFEKLKPSLEDIDNFDRGMDGVNQLYALEMAAGFESRSRDLYEMMAGDADDEEGRAIFEYLSRMEQAHYDIIEAQKNSISQTGLWIEIAGLGMETLL
jgi:rubrerythrin